MAYYSYPYIHNVPAHGYMDYWNGYNPYNTMREMPMPMPPKPEPPPMPPVKCPQPDRDYYTYPANLDEALRMIEEAVMGETGDVKFYEGLIKICEKMCDKEDRGIFEGIIADEHKHAQLFRTIYCEITGHVLPEAPEDKAKIPKTCCEGLKEAIFDELNAVERYRRILYAMQNRRHINMLVEIITDEQKHTQKLNYLYCKHCCGEKYPPKK
jgi:rubrerythrin